MRYFSVTEALQYLNELLPGVAPTNEETLRRAIRSGELKAEQRLGRGGNRIAEKDLMEYSQKYVQKAIQKNRKFASVGVLPAPAAVETTTAATQIMRKYLTELPENSKLLRIELLEARQKWESRINMLKLALLNTENELAKSQREINLIDDELARLSDLPGSDNFAEAE